MTKLLVTESVEASKTSMRVEVSVSDLMIKWYSDNGLPEATARTTCVPGISIVVVELAKPYRKKVSPSSSTRFSEHISHIPS